MHTCVVNLGLKSMRAAVFDQTGHRLAIAYRPIESRMGEGRVEQDPEDWWRAALETLDEVLADRELAGGSAGSPPRRRRAVSSRSTGRRPVRNAIMISDVRASDQAARISRDPAFAALGLPGGRVTPDLMLPKIVWLREHEPAHFARARWFAIAERLPGPAPDRRDRATDPTNATKYL